MTELHDEAVARETSPQSPLAALRARRDEVAENREVFISIPAYEEMGLKARYRLLGLDESEDIAKRVRKQTRDRAEFMYNVSQDIAIAALEGFILVPPGSGIKDEEADQLLDPDNAQPITTYAKLAEVMGWVSPNGQPTNRMAMWWVFGENEFSVGTHGLQLQRWMNNTNADVDSEFLGD